MPTKRKDLEVFNKRSGVKGIIVADNGDTLVVESNGINKTITDRTFHRWYTVIPQDKPEPFEERETEKVETPQEVAPTEPTDSKFVKVGEAIEIRKRFIELVKHMANQNLDFTYDDKNKRDIIKYNGRNVFECTTTRRKFNVLCHSKALTPDNIKRAEKVFPKEWGWALNVKFIFTSEDQIPLMKSIITDSLFYRQRGQEDE